MKPRKTTYMKPTANGTYIGRAGKLQYSYSGDLQGEVRKMFKREKEIYITIFNEAFLLKGKRLGKTEREQ